MKQTLISLVFLFILKGAHSFASTEIDLIYYNLNEDNNEAIVISGGIRKRANVIIPESVTYSGKEYRVTSIGKEAFYNCTWLVSISIPECVTSIGDYAFHGCSSLTAINIPEGVTSIGDHVFYECSSLTSIIIPEGVTSIGESAFSGCSGLTSIKIPEGVTTIGGYAFFRCNGLSIIKIDCPNVGNWFMNNQSTNFEVYLGDKVTSIGSYAFNGCSGMTSITIPEGVTSIGSFAFSGCSGLTSITIPEGVTSIGSSAFWGCSSLTTITIPESVTSIGTQAFSNCSGLTSITIPEGVTSIGSSAFEGCSGLTSINIPESVTSIGFSAFRGCSGLTSITVASGNTVYDSRNNCNAIIEKSSNTLIAGCENSIISNSVTSIGSSAFEGCSGLTSIKIPESVTSIGSSAFEDCSGLFSIYIPNNLKIIENGAFRGCTSLDSITIPESVTRISYYALTECKIVRTYNRIPISIQKTTFSSNATLIVPHGCKAAYEAAEYWNEFKEIVEKQEPFIDFADTNVKSICVSNWDTDGDGELSFDEAAAVTSLKNVFTNKKNIQSFDELQYFTGLKSINLMDFSSCSELTSIRIPENVTNIALSAFSTCTKLASVNIPESVTSIGTNAFYQCTSLSSITIPKNVNSISNNCFAGCSQLASITVDAENVVFDSRGNCNAIINKENSLLIAGCKNTTIPESVTDIASDAFRECTALLSITIPEGVRSIGSKAFDGCSALISVTINQPEPISISSTTFSNSVNATLYVPYKSKSVYASTDFWQDFKAIVEMPPTVFTLSDGQSFSNNEEIFVERLNYSRTFKNTNWQAWYVPFDVTLTSEILAHFAFAEFAGTYAEEDGSFYITVVRLKEGDVVKANTPYCVQAKVADSSNPQVISQTDVILKTSTVNSFYVLSARKRITFFGNYTHRTVTAEDENLYALSGGRYSKQQPGNTLAPYRCFFTIEDREDNPYATAPNPSEVKLMVIGEDDTFISELDFDNEVGPTVYDLNGRKVNRQKTTHGIYIINGKKVIIK